MKHTKKTVATGSHWFPPLVAIPEVAKTRQTFGQTLAFFSQLGATPTRKFQVDSQREKVPPPHTTPQRHFATFKRADNCKSRARARKVVTFITK